MCLWICHLFILFSSAAEDSAWWLKPAYQQKIREERAVMVYIKEDKTLVPSRYRMTGAGVVKAPSSFVLKKILAFSELEKVSSYFKKVVHQPEYNRVYFLLEAYGYQARMLIKYSVNEQNGKTIFHWNVVWGGFQGMIGDIELSSYKGDKTEAILKAQFDDKEIPLPKIFKSFVLEVIVQQVAKSMRSWIEDDFIATKGKT